MSLLKKSRRQENRLSQWATRKPPLPAGDKKVAAPGFAPIETKPYSRKIRLFIRMFAKAGERNEEHQIRGG